MIEDNSGIEWQKPSAESLRRRKAVAMTRGQGDRPKYELPRITPWWARMLGLGIDWQSRPGDREVAYYSDDRSVELVLGRRLLDFALCLWRTEDRTSLHFQVPLLNLFMKVGPGNHSMPLGEIGENLGVSIHDGVFRIELWGRVNWYLELNPFRWHGYESERLCWDHSWDNGKTYGPTALKDDWYTEIHPYMIASHPSFYTDGADRDVQITTWEATATCRVDRTTRTRRLLPWWKRIEYWVYFDLDEEVGRGKGSWKGGTMGFSEELLPGDQIEQVVERAARKSRGR